MVLQLIEVKSRDPICIGNRYFVSRGKILNNSYHFGAACLTLHQVIQNCGRITYDFSSVGHLTCLIALSWINVFFCVCVCFVGSPKPFFFETFSRHEILSASVVM